MAQIGTNSAVKTNCSICRGKNKSKRNAINSALAKGVSYRDIEAMTGVAYRTVGNHAQHIPALYREAKQKEILGQTINHQNEIKEQFQFAKELRIAAREFLTDPETGRLVLIPRSDEIEVIYDDYTDTNNRGEPKKKREKLQELIRRAEAANIEINKTEVKHVDIRSFALDAIKTTDLILDKVAKVEGLYSDKPKQNNNVNILVTTEDKARLLFQRLIERCGWTEEMAIEGIKQTYPSVDVKILTNQE